jgi:hypothetical protein
VTKPIFDIWPGTLGDVEAFLPHMRERDWVEIGYIQRAVGEGRPVWHVLVDSARASGPFMVMLDGAEIVAIMGINEVAPRVGIIWLLGTDRFDTDWRRATRTCKRCLEVFGPDFDVLGNILPDYDAQLQRWIRHLGFDTGEREANFSDEGFVPFGRSLVGPRSEDRGPA